MQIENLIVFFLKPLTSVPMGVPNV